MAAMKRQKLGTHCNRITWIMADSKSKSSTVVHLYYTELDTLLNFKGFKFVLFRAVAYTHLIICNSVSE